MSPQPIASSASSTNVLLATIDLALALAWPLVLTLVGASVFYLSSNFVTLLVRQHQSPLRDLRGPIPKSFFMGNLMEMHDQENDYIGEDGTDPTPRPLVARWEAVHGSTFVYRGFIGGCRLMTTDPMAVAHILGNAYRYPKPDFVRDSLATMAAGHEGMLTVEGEKHRRQRKILTPAFSSSHIKSLTPIFWRTAEQLRIIWITQSTEHQQAKRCHHTPPLLVDALSWLGRATLDVIGHAGFGYRFNALAAATAPSSMGNLSPDDSTEYVSPTDEEKSPGGPEVIKESELSVAFGVIFSTARKFRVITILQVWFPVLRRFRRNNATMIKAQATMRRIGLDLIAERSAEVVSEQAVENFQDASQGEKSVLGRDILSVLVRSNHASLPNQRMSIEEVLCQISTFIAAGHETTASALTWTLYALSKDDKIQRKLRNELRSYDIPQDQNGDPVPFDDLLPEQQASLESFVNNCEYLDWVVRESLRVHAPITNTMRVVLQDDEIPVMKPFLDRHGKTCSTIRVKKHDIISIPLQGINKSTDLWGEDAGVFRPERWGTPLDSTRAIPGLYSSLLTFLNGNPVDGNRACIGYKFALIEIKIFLFILCRDIEFTMKPSTIIEKKINVVTRPFVKSEPALGNQMPLYIRALDRDGETRLP